MIRFVLAGALALAALAQPASAQGDRWMHGESGISFPRSIGAMSLSREQDASGGANMDVILQYGDRSTPVTVYVYRSAYPNAAIWFERTRLAMNQNVGSGSAAANPRAFTFGNAPAPNGLREEISLAGGGATGVAIAQAGMWIVKVRITSPQLDRAQVSERMDRLLAAAVFARPIPAPHPLTVPGPCDGDGPNMRGERLRNLDSRAQAAAAVFGIVGYGEARGTRGLAAEPTAWCRVTRTSLPVQYGSVYRRRDGTGWVALIGDAGRAAAGGPVDLPGEARGILYASTPVSTQIVAVYDAIPGPDAAIELALPVVVGQARGIAEVGGEAPRQAPARKN
jgi:hypothetical protein